MIHPVICDAPGGPIDRAPGQTGARQGPQRSVNIALIPTLGRFYRAYNHDTTMIRKMSGKALKVAYEVPERDPLGQLRAVYDGVALGDFDAVRLALEVYLASIAGYRKNRHRPLDDATREKVARAWARGFRRVGLPAANVENPLAGTAQSEYHQI